MENLKNRKIQFLNGPQANIQTLKNNGGAVEGAFYLTDDSHRLYIGAYNSNAYTEINISTANSRFNQGKTVYGTKATDSQKKQLEDITDAIEQGYVNSAGTAITTGSHLYALKEGEKCIPQPINAGIEEVEDISDLSTIYPRYPAATTEDTPEEGAPTFYYVKNGNILCVYGETVPAVYTKVASTATYNADTTYYSYNSTTKRYSKATGVTSSNFTNYYTITTPATYGWIQINSDTYINSIKQDTAKVYVQSKDETVKSGKTYYTKSGSTYSTVSSPTGNPSTNPYYERLPIGRIYLQHNNSNEYNEDVQIRIVEGSNVYFSTNEFGYLVMAAKDTVGTLSTPSDGTLCLTNTYNTSSGTSSTSTQNITLAAGTYMDSIGHGTNKLTFNAKSQQIAITSTGTLDNATAPTKYSINVTQPSNNGTNTQTINIPAIKYGASHNKDAVVGYQMDVYTIAETNAKIAQAAADSLGAANAMQYKGVIDHETNNGTSDGTSLETLFAKTPSNISGAYEAVASGTAFDSTQVYYTRSGSSPNYIFTKADITSFASGTTYYTKKDNIESPGATYKVSTTFKLSKAINSTNYPKLNTELLSEIQTGKGLKAGDLLILNSSYKWDIIPAGEEQEVFKITSPKSDNPSQTLISFSSSTVDEIDLHLMDGDYTASTLKIQSDSIRGTNNILEVRGKTVGNTNTLQFRHKSVVGAAKGFLDTYVTSTFDNTNTSNTIADTTHNIGFSLGAESDITSLNEKNGIGYNNSVAYKYTTGDIGFNDDVYSMTKLVLDKQGHIIRTGWKKGKITHNRLTNYKWTNPTSTDLTKIQLNLYDSIGGTTAVLSPQFNFNSSTLSVSAKASASGNNKPAAINIDLVWGSF